MVPQTVTTYKAETKTRQVQVTTYKQVNKQVSFTYNELVPVTKPVQRTETFYTEVQENVPYTYTENQMVTEPVKQTRTVYKYVSKQF